MHGQKLVLVNLSRLVDSEQLRAYEKCTQRICCLHAQHPIFRGSFKGRFSLAMQRPKF